MWVNKQNSQRYERDKNRLKKLKMYLIDVTNDVIDQKKKLWK